MYLHVRVELSPTGRVVRYVQAELSATGRAVHGPSCPGIFCFTVYTLQQSHNTYLFTVKIYQYHMQHEMKKNSALFQKCRVQLEICRMQLEKHRCTRCDLLYITESYIWQIIACTPGLRWTYSPCKVTVMYDHSNFKYCNSNVEQNYRQTDRQKFRFLDVPGGLFRPGA